MNRARKRKYIEMQRQVHQRQQQQQQQQQRQKRRKSQQKRQSKRQRIVPLQFEEQQQHHLHSIISLSSCESTEIESDTNAKSFQNDDFQISDTEVTDDIFIPPPLSSYSNNEHKSHRLFIKKIVLKNFKSFAGTVEVGPFHELLTAVIGPNGNGKSNIMDAILFVFGCCASKLRCKKISNLIHNSIEYPNENRCSVAIHFKEISINEQEHTCEELNATDIVIERTVFRNNSSFYTVNDLEVSYLKVAELLKAYDIDLNNKRFLISQGEVDSIAYMKPKAGKSSSDIGLLEYLEELIGTNRYITPLKQLNEKVETIAIECNAKRNSFKFAERCMKDFENDYNLCIEYLQWENTYVRTKNLLYQKMISETKKDLAQLTAEICRINEELQEMNKKQANIKELLDKQQILNTTKSFEIEKKRKTQENLEIKLQKIYKLNREVQSMMKFTNETRRKRKIELEKLNEEFSGLEKIPQNNRRKINECLQQIEFLKQKRAQNEIELKENYVTQEKEIEPLILKRSKLENQLILFTENVNKCESKVKIIESELKIYTRNETQEYQKYETTKSKYSDTEWELQMKSKKLNVLKELAPKFQNEIDEKNLELQNLQLLEETKKK